MIKGDDDMDDLKTLKELEKQLKAYMERKGFDGDDELWHLIQTLEEDVYIAEEEERWA